MKNLFRTLICTSAFTLGFSAAGLAANSVPWSISGPGTTDAIQVDDDTWELNYSLVPSGFSEQTWTVTATAPVTGDYSFDWNYSGLHSFFQVTAFLGTFNPDTTLYEAGPVNCCTSPSNGFSETGEFTFDDIIAGETFGFLMKGSHFDSANILQGTLTLTQTGAPAPVPEPASLLGLFAVGAMATSGALKKNR